MYLFYLNTAYGDRNCIICEYMRASNCDNCEQPAHLPS